MKEIGYILFGIIIGLLMHNFFKISDKDFRQKNDIKSDLMSSTEISEAKHSAPIVKAKTEEKAKTLPPSAINNMEIENAHYSNQTETKSDIKPRIVELNISEEIVTELEKNWQDLPNQIQLSAEGRGLRVRYLAENSLFIKVGLQSGDLISYETLQSMKNSNSNTYQLSNRVIKLLNHVQ